jgi:hypothetical protein
LTRERLGATIGIRSYLGEEEQMETYNRPALIASYSIADLLAGAAIAMEYASDRALKRGVEEIEQPLERLGAIRTD